ncbi:MAG: aminopeptidase [Bacilli bacterium]|nr:aminopeptidase [Bacilli bacterium]
MEEKLSKTVVNYSLKVEENERVLITYMDDSSKNLVKYLIKEIVSKKGIPFTKRVDADVNAILLENTKDNCIDEIKVRKEFEVEHYDSFITIFYNGNEYEERHVPAEVRAKIGKATRALSDIRTNERKWVLLNYPSIIDAYKAKMPYEEFYEYAFKTMVYNYAEMKEKIEPLKKLMEKTDKVRVTGKDTDITFSIKDIPAIPCMGESNIPDGEIFTAPVKDSIEGTITYNTPSPYRGDVYHNVSLTFEKGKIVKATCQDDNEKLNEIFDTDEGSRYVGEFAFGLNPYIREPMGDILFDEKIIGSIHFTPGAAYKEAYNGNESSVHWDMVLIQREEYGGGDIYFDDVLIRHNGKFILKELEPLNEDVK